MSIQVITRKSCSLCCSLHPLTCRVKACCHKAVHGWHQQGGVPNTICIWNQRRGTEVPAGPSLHACI